MHIKHMTYLLTASKSSFVTFTDTYSPRILHTSQIVTLYAYIYIYTTSYIYLCTGVLKRTYA